MANRSPGILGQAWEYCLLTCTPMTGVDEGGVRLVYHLVTPERVHDQTVHSDHPSPFVAINRLLNQLGQDGWELVSYDTATNRGVFKRPKA